MNSTLHEVSARLSLRVPQHRSLEILSHVTQLTPLIKGGDVQTALAAIRSEYPSVYDFEREFPSVCFALATGVGKTRLMAAFIAFLYLDKGMRNFLILAPNLTIYNKLISDFSPGKPKYALTGIGEFAHTPPQIVTGDTYERGHGVRGNRLGLFGLPEACINIFNISKINSEIRGGSLPRIKRLSEYIGESYFEYLAGLSDLVLLMDESHRYRASAGVRAINELKPVLGLEVTATPQTETSRGIKRFKNIIYDYPLSQALQDGFVKQPAVATREDFDASNYSETALEHLKVSDGITVHEAVKAELATYATQHCLTRVKPFMLIIARDTEHAERIRSLLEDNDFFQGTYKGRVITVHSNIGGEEKDETVERLLKVESPDEPTEVVIHVNMLKEGWDVTNLYTIVPLRAAHARTLVQQSIGRGLRLPYGTRTGVLAVDRLTIVAHDRFQEIVDEANRPDSLIRIETVMIGRDISGQRQVSIVVPSNFDLLISGVVTAPEPELAGAPVSLELAAETARKVEVSTAIAKATSDAIRDLEYLPSAKSLQRPAVHERLVALVTDAIKARTLETTTQAEIGPAVSIIIDAFVNQTLDVPQIVLSPVGVARSGFADFELEPPSHRFSPVDDSIIVHGLADNVRDRIRTDDSAAKPLRMGDYLVAVLSDYPDISYGDVAPQLYKLSEQLISHLRSYLPDERAVENVLRHHARSLADVVHTQMVAHRWVEPVAFERVVRKGFTRHTPMGFTVAEEASPTNFRIPVDEPQYIKGTRFSGFSRCVYPEQRFDSDPERRFAILLEDDAADVIKWFKPGRGQLNILYSDGRAYEPDFVVETRTRKLLCEVKRSVEVSDPTVRLKALAAAEWCKHATEHEMQHEGKPWSYVLIPDAEIHAARTLSSIVSMFTVTAAS